MLEFGVNGWCIINGDSTKPAPELLETFERRFCIDAIGIGCITVRAWTLFLGSSISFQEWKALLFESYNTRSSDKISHQLQKANNWFSTSLGCQSFERNARRRKGSQITTNLGHYRQWNHSTIDNNELHKNVLLD